MKVLVADDEPLARRRLEGMLEDLGMVVDVVFAANGAEAVSVARDERPDVVLMDIRMPRMDGIEAAYALAALKPPPAVVFTTAYDEHALAAFDANAVDYLLKPVKRERLEAAIAKARALNQGQADALKASLGEAADGARTQLSATVHGRLKVVPVAEVLCLRADQKYTEVVWRGEPLIIDESLKQLEAELGDRFVRVHRNALVRIDAVVELARDRDGQTVVTLKGMDAPVPVARRLVARVRERLKSG